VSKRVYWAEGEYDVTVNGHADWSSDSVEVGGLRLHYVQAGPADGTPVILLHGFPEFWYSWRYQLPALAAAGYRAIAPDQRGYNLSGKQGPYDIETLTDDIAHLQDALGLTSSHIVGHDWGGAVAWAFAARYPGRTRRLAVLNAPHLNAYQDAALRHPTQLLKSWYILFFQLPHLPEWVLRQHDYYPLERGLARVDPTHMTPADSARYKQSWRQPGALSAMLGWYRAMGRHAARQPRLPRLPRLDIGVPTALIWGLDDPYLDRACNATLHRYVSDLRIHYLPGAGHWVQMNCPDETNHLLLDFLRQG